MASVRTNCQIGVNFVIIRLIRMMKLPVKRDVNRPRSGTTPMTRRLNEMPNT